MKSQRLSVVDLFCGSGGASLGFQQAGCKIVGAVDLDPNACSTYERNIGFKPICGNLRTITGSKIREEFGLNKGDVDVVVGCPPCQSFSSLRRTTKGDRADSRDDLVMVFAKRVAELQPRIVIFENVSGIAHGRGEVILESFNLRMKRLNYEGESRVLNAADYGVPQFRKRLIAIFARKDDGIEGAPSFPRQTHYNPRLARERDLEAWRTVRDAIGDLLPLNVGETAPHPPNHTASVHTPKVLKMIQNIPLDGGSRTSLPAELRLKCHRNLDGAQNVYGRMSWSKPGPTITTRCNVPACGRFIHPEQDRAITPREAARIQSFPDSFVFDGPLRDVTLHIGNAMPIELTRAVAAHLARD